MPSPMGWGGMIVAFAAACASACAHGRPSPAQAPAQAVPAPAEDPIARLIAQAEEQLATGMSELKQGHLNQARAAFDRAIEAGYSYTQAKLRDWLAQTS